LPLLHTPDCDLPFARHTCFRLLFFTLQHHAFICSTWWHSPFLAFAALLPTRAVLPAHLPATAAGGIYPPLCLPACLLPLLRPTHTGQPRWFTQLRQRRSWLLPDSPPPTPLPDGIRFVLVHFKTFWTFVTRFAFCGIPCDHLTCYALPYFAGNDGPILPHLPTTAAEGRSTHNLTEASSLQRLTLPTGWRFPRMIKAAGWTTCSRAYTVSAAGGITGGFRRWFPPGAH